MSIVIIVFRLQCTISPDSKSEVSVWGSRMMGNGREEVSLTGIGDGLFHGACEKVTQDESGLFVDGACDTCPSSEAS